MNMAATRMLMGDAAKYLGIILRLMIRTFGAITNQQENNIISPL